MTKRKLRGYVLPTVYVLLLIAIFTSVFFISKSLKDATDLPYNHVTEENSVKDGGTTQTVNKETKNLQAVKPFTDESVAISKSFYDKDAEASTQENSLIYYQNTYMPNTGILYTSDTAFDCIATLDGTIKDIKTDEILGTVIFLEHASNLTTMYYSLTDLKVEKGASVKQGDILGTSGKSGLEKEKEYNLLFEVSKDGSLINPETFYNMSSEELAN